MNDKLDHYLVVKYPKIFQHRNAEPMVSPMGFGFCCGDGWFNILDRACSLISSHISHIEDQNEMVRSNIEKINNKEKVADWVLKNYKENKLVIKEVPSFIATQVKEKFGTLRFYYTGGDEYIDGVLRMCEAMSSVTCEVCGNVGKLGGFGYISTKCKKHKVDKASTKVKKGQEIVVLSKSGMTRFLVNKVISAEEIEGFCYNGDDLSNVISKAKLEKTVIFNYWEIF